MYRLKKAYDTVRREVLYNILIVGGTCGLKQGEASSSLLLNFALEYAIR
jgi:hypothetical protein